MLSECIKLSVFLKIFIFTITIQLVWHLSLEHSSGGTHGGGETTRTSLQGHWGGLIRRRSWRGQCDRVSDMFPGESLFLMWRFWLDLICIYKLRPPGHYYHSITRKSITWPAATMTSVPVSDHLNTDIRANNLICSPNVFLLLQCSTFYDVQ